MWLNVAKLLCMYLGEDFLDRLKAKTSNAPNKVLILNACAPAVHQGDHFSVMKSLVEK